MTATYMAVTAAAVLLTELVIFGMAALAPATSTPLPRQEVQSLAQATAAGLAAKLALSVSPDGRLPGNSLGTAGAPVTPGQAVLDDATHELRIPQTTTPACDLAPASFAVVVSRDRTVLATSYPACFPVGGQGVNAQGGAPTKTLFGFGWPVGGSGLTSDPTGNVAWVATPIVALAPASKNKATRGSDGTGQDGAVFAMVYLQVPAVAFRSNGYAVPAVLAWSGIAVLAGAVPVGLGVRVAVHPPADSPPQAARHGDDGGSRRRVRASHPGFWRQRGVRPGKQLQPHGEPVAGISQRHAAPRRGRGTP